MTSPLAWLAGLGAGAESLGGDINQRELLRRAKERQDAQDALELLKTVTPMGGQVLPAGQDPSQMLQRLTQHNNAVSGLIPGGTPSAIPNEATGMPEDTLPNAFGSPYTAKIGQSNVVFDPSQAPEARILRREESKQAAEQRRQEALANQRTATALSEKQAASTAGYNTFKALFPEEPLAKQPLTPEQISTYDWQGAIKDKQASRALDAAAAREDARIGAMRPPTPQYEEFVDPQGQHHYVPKEEGAKQGWLPAQKGTNAAAAGQTMAMLARLKQVSNDIGSADPEMTKFEDPRSPLNVTQVNPLLKARVTAADAMPNLESHGMTGAAGNAATAMFSGFAQQGLTNPLEQGYRNYATRVKTIGLGLGEINPRPNNALIGIETSLSGADLGNNPERTSIVQQRRRNAKKSMDAILAMNPAFVEAMQQQDPNWIDKQIKAGIMTGAVPQGPSGGTPSSAATPDINDVEGYLKALRSKKS